VKERKREKERKKERNRKKEKVCRGAVCIAEMVEHMHEALHSIPVWQEESKVC
jgi:hypothetical protein